MRGELELRHLRVLLAVYDHGGYTRAARALGVSQSTVSETVAALERALGTALVRRAGTRVALTPAGEALLGPAREMLGLAARARERVAEASRAAQVTVTIGANESVSSYLLPAHLAELRREWPRATIQVSSAMCEEIREQVRLGRLDLGLSLEPAASGADGEEIVARHRLALVVAPGHPLAGTRASSGRLWDEQFVLSDAAGSYHAVLRGWFARGGFGPPRTVAVGSIEGVKRAASRPEGGVGVLPAFTVAGELDSGVLAETQPDPPLPEIGLHVRTRAGSGSPIVRELVERLR